MSDNTQLKRIYVFGNPDYQPDSVALRLANRLKDLRPELEFIVVKPNEDLPFIDENRVVIMDAMDGISSVTILTDRDLDRLVLAPRSSVHEFDLGFQLKYLKKLGKLKQVTIIGIPLNGEESSVKQITAVLDLILQG